MIEEQHLVQVKSCEEVTLRGISLRSLVMLRDRIIQKLKIQSNSQLSI
jgi:hypothetical protein